MPYEIIETKRTDDGTIYYLRNLKYQPPTGEVDLTLAIDDESNLYVWGDTGANCWFQVNNREFYRNIALELKILS